MVSSLLNAVFHRHSLYIGVAVTLVALVMPTSGRADELSPDGLWLSVCQPPEEHLRGAPWIRPDRYHGVLLDNAVLDAPLPQADAQLAQMHHQYAQARLQALSSAEPLAPQLRAWIVRRLPLGLPTRVQAAQALGLSERTLARRMQAQGLSFSALLDEARRDAALHAVAHTDRALGDIGQSLGFAEPSTFWRAFRRWTGGTPQAWRSQAQAQA